MVKKDKKTMTECICHQNVHTIECKIYNRKIYGYKKNKESRARKVKNHLCWSCGKPVSPELCPHCNKIIKYKKRCNNCLSKNI